MISTQNRRYLLYTVVMSIIVGTDITVFLTKESNHWYVFVAPVIFILFQVAIVRYERTLNQRHA